MKRTIAVIFIFAVAATLFFLDFYGSASMTPRGVTTLPRVAEDPKTGLLHAPDPESGASRKRFLLAISNCNGADMVQRLLSLSAFPDYVQPFIFDDASFEDPSGLDIRKVAHEHGAYVFQSTRPRGLTYAWNSAFFYFKLSPRNYSHMCMTNNDVVIPAGAIEELVAVMDAHPEHHIWGPMTMLGGLSAFGRLVPGEVYFPNVTKGGYSMQQMNVQYPGMPGTLRFDANVKPEAAQTVQHAIGQSVRLQEAFEKGGAAAVSATLAVLDAEDAAAAAAAAAVVAGVVAASNASRVVSAATPAAPSSRWPAIDSSSGAPLNENGKPHGGWAPPRVRSFIKPTGPTHLLGYFLCLPRTSIDKERPGGDWVLDSLINLHQESDIRDSGWNMAVASRAFVWHSKASTLSQVQHGPETVNRNDVGVCHRRSASASAAPPAPARLR